MATRKRQSLKRAITKTVARTIIYRAVNDVLDLILNAVSEKLEPAPVQQKKTRKTK